MKTDIVRPDNTDLEKIRIHLDYTIAETFKIEGVYESHYDEYLEEVDYQLNQIKKDFLRL